MRGISRETLTEPMLSGNRGDFRAERPGAGKRPNIV
jgi:hypothetical protein